MMIVLRLVHPTRITEAMDISTDTTLVLSPSRGRDEAEWLESILPLLSDLENRYGFREISPLRARSRCGFREVSVLDF